MMPSQRDALVGMIDAILARDCAPADIRLRAESLRACLIADTLGRWLDGLCGR